MRQILGIYGAPRPHWVGDGFPVRTVLSPHDQGGHASPFLLLDYAGPARFTPTTARRGVGAHPHKGFETVTIVYAGEVEHRDSTGAGGIIGPGDVQWMTAGAGIVHEEFHSPAFAARGGAFEVVQLWVNLPARHKGAVPAYQSLAAASIPEAVLPGGAGTLRVIAGAWDGVRGPARTFTPMDLWDLRLGQGREATLAPAEGQTLALLVRRGVIEMNGRETAREAELALFGREGGPVTLRARGDAAALVLAGEPIAEPVVAHGPFVMNTAEEIDAAMREYREGRFGALVG